MSYVHLNAEKYNASSYLNVIQDILSQFRNTVVVETFDGGWRRTELGHRKVRRWWQAELLLVLLLLEQWSEKEENKRQWLAVTLYRIKNSWLFTQSLFKSRSICLSAVSLLLLVDRVQHKSTFRWNDLRNGVIYLLNTHITALKVQRKI